MLEVRLVRRIHAGLTLDVDAPARRARSACCSGPPGAGKTSLLRLITGTDRPDAGFDSAGTIGPLRLGPGESPSRFAGAGSA